MANPLASDQHPDLAWPSAAHIDPTPILDYQAEAIQRIRNELATRESAPRTYLQSAHQLIHKNVAAVYTVDELQPASMTFRRRQGSCSQRFACLEALARANGIATCARALWIDGRFWAPRFPLCRYFIPRRILLVMPQFFVDGRWLGAESLFGSLDELAAQNSQLFTNTGESLFDAVSHMAVDFMGSTVRCAGGRCSLAHFLVEDAGTFISRDALFATFPLFQHTFRGRMFELLFGGRKSS